MPLGNFPHILQNGPGNTPDADQVMANWQHIRTYLNSTGWLAGSELAANAVTTSKIADAAITSAKIGVNQITGFHILNNTIGTGHLQTNSVTGFQIANSTVATGHLQDNTVTSAKASLTGVYQAATGDLNLSGSFQTVPGMGASLSTGAWVIGFSLGLRGGLAAGGQHEARLTLNGVKVGTLCQAGVEASGPLTRNQMGQVFVIIGGGAIAVQARRTSGSNGAVFGETSALAGVRIG